MSDIILLFVGISIIILFVLILVEVYVCWRFEKDLLNGKLPTDEQQFAKNKAPKPAKNKEKSK